jgi:hypothetical protein
MQKITIINYYINRITQKINFKLNRHHPEIWMVPGTLHSIPFSSLHPVVFEWQSGYPEHQFFHLRLNRDWYFRG